MKRANPVAVTGMGCICAPGKNLVECLTALWGGERSPAPPRRFQANHPLSYPVFEVREDWISDSIGGESPLSLTAGLALQAAREALNQAELEKDFLRTLKAGVCLGTTVGSAMNNEAFYQAFKQGLEPDMSPIHRFLKSNPAACLAREYGLDGPCQTVVNACSSGTDAIGLAASWIESGYCDLVLAGGSDELSHVTYNGFISLMISDDAPCRPFDRERKGLNLGEGAAVMVLESEKTRQGRRKKAKAFILGYGAACDAHHLTAPHPEGNGLKQAIREALQVSGTTAEDLSFINAHGTGTRDNDRVETLVLQEYLAGVPFLSTKGFTGHTLGAAGAIEAVFTAACLETGQIPESAGFIVDDPELPCSPVKEATTVKGKAALSQSLAFGGHNAVIVIGQGEERL